MDKTTPNNGAGWIGTTIAMALPMTLVSLLLALVNG